MKTDNRTAQSASALGAGILGFAIGGMWGNMITELILIVLIVIGSMIHLNGMYLIYSAPLRSSKMAKILLGSAWLCLLFIAGLLIYLLFKN